LKAVLPKFVLEKMGLAYSNGFWDLIWKILDGENIPTQELTYFHNLQDTIAPSALKRQSYIRKLRVKMG
jgi:hypothetical protein